MEAKDLFRDLGFIILNQDKNVLVYSHKDDYNEMFVYFDLMIEMYSVTWHRFIDNLYDYVPMAKRPKDLKHTCRYGHWQHETSVYIDAKLHNAIHKQMIELGWIK